MPTWLRPHKWFSSLAVLLAAGMTTIALLIVGATWAAPGKEWYWNIVIPLVVGVYLWIVWTLALAGVWLGKQRAVLVSPMMVRILDPKDVEEIGVDELLGGFLSMAYVKYRGRKLRVLGMSSYRVWRTESLQRAVQDLKRWIEVKQNSARGRL